MKPILLALIFSINFSLVTSKAQHTLTIDDIKFDTTTGTITDYYSDSVDIIIPVSFNINGEDVNVVSIGDTAFSNNSLATVTIPNSVRTIGRIAFYKNALTRVTLEQNSYIRLIEEGAFAYNTDLTSITLPSNVNPGFSGYKDKEGNSYTPGNDITNFDYSCSYHAVLPAHTLTLDDVDFTNGEITNYSGGYVDIIIPASFNVNGEDVSVTYIRENTFYYSSLTDIIIPNSITHIGNYAFSNNSLASVTFPNSVTFIGDYAFNNNSLTSIIIPNRVTTIGDWAFTGNNLTSVTFEQNSYIRLIGSHAFNNYPSLTSIVLPINNNPGFSGYKDRNGNSYNEGDDITEYITTYYADLPTHTLTPSDVEFHEGEITNYFAGYTNIIIPPSFNVNGTDVGVNSIRRYTFYDIPLTSVTIPNSMTEIGDWAFADNLLSNVTIPSSITIIRERTFNDNSLTSVTLPNSLTAIEMFAFSSNSLTTISIPNSVTTIGRGAFSYNLLTSVTIPNSVTTIGDWAFVSNSLTSITLPAPVIKEGYIFTKWQDGLYNVVTQITNFNTSYVAQFNSTTAYTVSGSIDINDITNLTLNITGDFTGTRPVNANGTYSFELNAGRNIVITPVKEDYSFSPASIAIDNIQSELTNQDFAQVTTAVNNLETSPVNIYPNPVSSVLTIETSGTYTNLQIINLSGTVIEFVDCAELSTVQVNMEHLMPGVYFIKLQGKKDIVIKKVLKN